MLSQIYFVPDKENVNGQRHMMDDCLGHGFERHMLNVLSNELAPFYDLGVKIYPTPSSRDDGKDIIVESPINLNSFIGFPFPLRGKKRIRIYIECKSSNSGNITYNQIAGNVARIKDDNIDYYVLITNTTIAPFSYYQFNIELEKLGINFLLIDQFLLNLYLQERKSEIGTYSLLPQAPTFNIAYQFLSTFQNGKQIYKLYLLMRNYKNCVVNMQLKINTDRNWNISQQTIKHVLESRCAHCVELIITKEYYDGLDELLVSLAVEGQEVFTKIKGLNWKSSFIPPLCGKQHREIIDIILKQIYNADKYYFSCLWGEAGVGKTRIIDELLTNVQGRDVDAAVFSCVKNGDIRKSIKEFLINKGFLSSKIKSNSLLKIFPKINTQFRKLFLIIDDLHGADSAFLKEINKTSELMLDTPIVLLVVGRNDYSEGLLEYYTLIQQCLNTFPKYGWVLESLDEDDAKQFIKLLVQDIPEFALNKIYELSNRVPLFIVECIEYLLDLKLVNIVNRFSVGVQNPESFSSHLDIPKKIEDIYSKRLKNLTLLPKGEQLSNFLLACTILGNSFPYEMAASFFKNPEKDTKPLFERRFLQIDDNGKWQYVHESLYLFLQQQVSSSPILRKKCSDLICGAFQILNTLHDLQKGRVYLWSGQIKKATTYFQPALKEIEHTQNHSNIEIKQVYYDYLEDFYTCTSDAKLQEKIILCKVYIALHYYTPYIAIHQCQWARQVIQSSKDLKTKKEIELMLKEHEAHCYLNAGQLKRADQLLQDLLVATIGDSKCMSAPTLFDLYDKLSNLNIKYNNKETALRFIRLSEKIADCTGDDGLKALAYITHGKLLFFSNCNQTLMFTEKVSKYFRLVKSNRIQIHNEITKLMIYTIKSSENIQSLQKILIKAKLLLDDCIKNQYANSVIRVNLLLGVICFLTNTTNGNMESAKQYLYQGINASIQFGIGTYIWQIYNLLAIIAVNQNDSQNSQARLFETVYLQLRRQGLLYIGSSDFCYGNLLAISNLAGFYALHGFESEFYQKMGSISYIASPDVCDYNCNKQTCNYVCSQSTERLKNELKRFQKALDNQKRLPLPFQDIIPQYKLWDDKSKCYIILS